MSGAAAVAYRLPDATGEQPSRGLNTREYHLLGMQQAATATASRYGGLRSVPPMRSTGFHMQQKEDAPYIGYYASDHLPQAALRPGGNRLARPLSVALAGLALIGVAIPAVMNAIPARSQTLMLSGYRDLGTKAASPSKPEVAGPQPVVIDATSGTGPQVEVQKPQPAASQPGAYSILGPPSLSVNQIEVVLRQYGSPAAGLGQKLYDLGVKYGIDPAYALAFFLHESGGGTKGVARFSKSLGNIRWTEGYGNYEGYRSYPTWEAGMEDWYRLITDLYINGWGLRTVDAIIPVYAPWGDNNNPPGYIASVKAMVDSWRGK